MSGIINTEQDAKLCEWLGYKTFFNKADGRWWRTDGSAPFNVPCEYFTKWDKCSTILLNELVRIGLNFSLESLAGSFIFSIYTTGQFPPRALNYEELACSEEPTIARAVSYAVLEMIKRDQNTGLGETNEE